VNDPECIYFITTQGLDVKKLYWVYPDPEKWPRFDQTLREFEVREEFIKRYGFAILTREAIEAIRPYGPLLEIGAGSGYWAYELTNYGIDVIATDNLTENFGWFREGKTTKQERWKKHYIEIEKLEAVDAVRKYPNRNLLIVWPSYGGSWAADALEVFTGQVVVYMGEWGDACAEDRFFDLLDQRFSDQVWIRMPHFWGLHDRYLKICRQPKQLIERTK
jgi:hypothetical protein